MMTTLIRKEIQKRVLARLGAPLCRGAFASIRQETNYEDAGGAPLLGVDGIVIISHGISSAKAIRNAIRAARESIVERINDHIIEGIANHLGPPQTGSATQLPKLSTWST